MQAFWTPVSLLDAPNSRHGHTAIWTGREMIIWGGLNRAVREETVNSGGQYDPYADRWVATPVEGAPFPRYIHSAVRTGSHMIIWGEAQEGVEALYWVVALP